jgi:hypothetical protein
MVLLNRGIYCRKSSFPDNLKKMLIGVMDKPTKESQTELVDSLSTLWKPIPAKDFIENVIENLTFQYLLKTSSDDSLSKIEKAVSSFLLLVVDKDTIGRISQKVHKKNGGYSCSNSLVRLHPMV